MYALVGKNVRRFFFPVGETQDMWQFVETQEVTGSAVQTLTFSGLSGDKRYLLVGDILGTAGASGSVVCRPNGETTNQIAIRHNTFSGGPTHGVSESTTLICAAMRVSDWSDFIAMINCVSGRKRLGSVELSFDWTAGGEVQYDTWGWLSTTTAAVTSIDVHATDDLDLDVGSKVHLFELVAA